MAEAGAGGVGGGSPPARQAPGGRAAGAGGGAGAGPSPGAGPQTQAEGARAGAAAGNKEGRGGGEGAGVGVGTKYLMAGSEAWRAQAERVKGELSAVASTARLMLHKKDGPTFQSVVLGYPIGLGQPGGCREAVPGGRPGGGRH